MSKMALKAGGGGLKGMRKPVAKVVHGNIIKTYIPAAMAAAGPPLGPQLGQRGINIATFVKDFNERTKEYKEGIPLPCRITVNSDRSYELEIHKPPVSYFLKQAAGLERGGRSLGDNSTAGKVTLKHIYEISKIKQEDPALRFRSLEEICRMTIGAAHSIGIEVVHSLDPVEYAEFLEERKLIVEEQLKQLKEQKEAKMLRA